MTTSTLETAAVGTDIAECDREPIQFSGAIQPHGLLALVDARLSLVGGAGLGAEVLFPLGAPAFSVLGVDLAKRMAGAPEGAPALIGRTRLRGLDWDVVAHRATSGWSVEFEPAPSGPRLSAEDVLAQLDEAGGAFERAGDLNALCSVGASAFQGITGFDHVMIYRFLDDGSGMVLAEERAAGTRAFLNHHFPASDIPQQARGHCQSKCTDAGSAPARPRLGGSRRLKLKAGQELGRRAGGPEYLTTR